MPGDWTPVPEFRNHVLYLTRLTCGHCDVSPMHPLDRLYGCKICGRYCPPVIYSAIYPARVPDYPVLIWH